MRRSWKTGESTHVGEPIYQTVIHLPGCVISASQLHSGDISIPADGMTTHFHLHLDCGYETDPTKREDLRVNLHQALLQLDPSGCVVSVQRANSIHPHRMHM